MRLTITARRFKLSEDLKAFVEDEVMRLKKYYDQIIDVEVILSWEKADRLAEINLSVYGTLLTAHERAEKMEKAVTLVVDKLERQVKKYKEKLREFDHQKAVPQEVVESEASEEEEF